MLLKNKYIYVLLLVPLLFYPIFFGLVFLGDSLVGDRLILYHYLHVSRRQLAEMILTDFWRAMAVFYAISGAVAMMVVSTAVIRKKFPTVWFSLSVGLVFGICSGWILAKVFGIVVLFAVSSFGVSGVMHLVLRHGLKDRYRIVM